MHYKLLAVLPSSGQRGSVWWRRRRRRSRRGVHIKNLRISFALWIWERGGALAIHAKYYSITGLASIHFLVSKLSLLPPLVVVDPQGRVASIAIAIQRRSSTISGAIAVAGTVSGSCARSTAKVLWSGSGNQLLGVLGLGSAARGQDQVIDTKVNQSHDQGHNGQPLVAAGPVLQLEVLSVAGQANQSAKALAWRYSRWIYVN